jgi:hypothetical protein
MHGTVCVEPFKLRGTPKGFDVDSGSLAGSAPIAQVDAVRSIASEHAARFNTILFIILSECPVRTI